MHRFVAVALISSCLKPVVPSPTPVLPAPKCSASDPFPVPASVCDGRFTQNGFACVICVQPYQNCTDTYDQVYCATSCSDPLCSYAGARARGSGVK